jgi:hypothetical protein
MGQSQVDTRSFGEGDEQRFGRPELHRRSGTQPTATPMSCVTSEPTSAATARRSRARRRQSRCGGTSRKETPGSRVPSQTWCPMTCTEKYRPASHEASSRTYASAPPCPLKRLTSSATRGCRATPSIPRTTKYSIAFHVGHGRIFGVIRLSVVFPRPDPFFTAAAFHRQRHGLRGLRTDGKPGGPAVHRVSKTGSSIGEQAKLRADVNKTALAQQCASQSIPSGGDHEGPHDREPLVFKSAGGGT